MDVDAAVAGYIQQGLGKDLAEGDHDDQVGGELPDELDEFRGAHLGGLHDGNAVRLRQDLDRRRGQLLTPSLRPVGLGDYRQDLLASLDQPLQGGTGECRRPHEYQAQLRHYSISCSSRRRRYFLLKISRFRGEIWSMKRMPSR